MNERHFVVKSSTKFYTSPAYSTYSTYSHNKDKNQICSTNDDLATLVRLRDRIITKLAAYQKYHYKSHTAINKIDQKTVAPNNEMALKNATIEIDNEIDQFETLAKKYWEDSNQLWYAKSATRRYAHIDNESNFSKYETELNTKAESKKILDGLKENEGAGYSSWWWSYSYQHQCDLQKSKGYNFWYSLIRDHSVPVVTLVYTLPLLIGVSIVHGIDALISHIRAFAADSAAEKTFTEKTNEIEDNILSNEKVVVEQTLFEITREFQTQEYKDFSGQCKSLRKVGFFTPKSKTLEQACEDASVSANVPTIPAVMTPVYRKG